MLLEWLQPLTPHTCQPRSGLDLRITDAELVECGNGGTDEIGAILARRLEKLDLF